MMVMKRQALLAGVLACLLVSTALQAAQTLTSTDEFQATSGEFGPRDQMPGAALYGKHCVRCYNGSEPKAPQTMWLEKNEPGSNPEGVESGRDAIAAYSLVTGGTN